MRKLKSWHYLEHSLPFASEHFELPDCFPARQVDFASTLMLKSLFRSSFFQKKALKNLCTSKDSTGFLFTLVTCAIKIVAYKAFGIILENEVYGNIMKSKFVLG